MGRRCAVGQREGGKRVEKRERKRISCEEEKEEEVSAVYEGFPSTSVIEAR